MVAEFLVVRICVCGNGRLLVIDLMAIACDSMIIVLVSHKVGVSISSAISFS